MKNVFRRNFFIENLFDDDCFYEIIVSIFFCLNFCFLQVLIEFFFWQIIFLSKSFLTKFLFKCFSRIDLYSYLNTIVGRSCDNFSNSYLMLDQHQQIIYQHQFCQKRSKILFSFFLCKKSKKLHSLKSFLYEIEPRANTHIRILKVAKGQGCKIERIFAF